MSTPAYTVVTPVHNGRRYITRAIASALRQDPAGEIIVVDDGSTDDSGTIARQSGDGVTVLRNDAPAGPSAARNRAISASAAPIIAFLDADDQWEVGKLARQLALLEAHPELVAVFTDFKTVDPDGHAVGWQGGILAQLRALGTRPRQVAASSYVLDGPVAEALIRHTSFMHPSSVVARKDALQRAGMFDPSFTAAEDLDLWIRLAGIGPIAYIDEGLLTIESRPDSQGHKTQNMCEHLLRLYATLDTRVASMRPETREHVRVFRSEKYLQLGWLQVHDEGNLTGAQKSYFKSLQLRWTMRSALALLKVTVARLLPRRAARP